MANDTAAGRALAASRIKICFATWRPLAQIGVSAARCAKYRFTRVGFENQIPKRLSLQTEYFNADVFFTAGPMKLQILNAYQRQDKAVLERLLLISLFSRGSAYWQSGSLKPATRSGDVSTSPAIYSDKENTLYWSGLETKFWHEVANTVENSESLDAEKLDQILADRVGFVVS